MGIYKKNQFLKLIKTPEIECNHFDSELSTSTSAILKDLRNAQNFANQELANTRKIVKGTTDVRAQFLKSTIAVTKVRGPKTILEDQKAWDLK